MHDCIIGTSPPINFIHAYYAVKSKSKTKTVTKPPLSLCSIKRSTQLCGARRERQPGEKHMSGAETVADLRVDHPTNDRLQSECHTPGDRSEAASQVTYVPYDSELQMPDIMKLMKADLSEPYSIYTYRYFIHNWPRLCILAWCDDHYVGAIVCKLEVHHYNTRRGYIAMLAVDKDYRKRKIGQD